MTEESGLGVEAPGSFEEAVMHTRISLRARGFGILSEMPVPPGVGEAGEAGRRHLFLAVWQSLLAVGNLGGQGLDVGDHMHLNVVVFEDEGRPVVAVLDPTEGIEGWDEASQTATSARRALTEVLEDVAAGLD